MEIYIVHPVVTGRGFRLTDDPVAVVKLREGEYAVLVALDDLYDLACILLDQGELNTRHILAAGIDLDVLHSLELVHPGANGFLRGLAAFLDFQFNNLAGNEVRIIRRVDFLDSVLAGGYLAELEPTVLIGNNGLHQFALFVVQTECSACQRLVILVYLQAEVGVLLVLDHSRIFLAVNELAVHYKRLADRAFKQVIAVQGLGFLNRELAVRDLLEHDLAVFIGQGCHNSLVFLIEQRELYALHGLVIHRVNLEELHTGVIIRNGRMSDDLAVVLDLKFHNSHVQFVAFRSEDFLEGVLTGYKLDIRDLTVLIRVLTVNDIAFFVIDLDQGTRDCFIAGDRGLGDRNGVDNLMVHDLFRYRHYDDILIHSLVIRRQGYAEGLIRHLPAFRSLQFLDVVFTVRHIACQVDITVVVCCCYSEASVSGQGSAVQGCDPVLIKETEHEAGTGQFDFLLVNHTGFEFIRHDMCLDLDSGQVNRQVLVIDIQFLNNDLGLVVRELQFDIIRGCIVHVSVRSTDFNHVILAKRQVKRILIRAVVCCGDRVNQFVLCVPCCAVLADNILSGVDLEHSVFKVAVLEDRHVVFDTGLFVCHGFKAYELFAAFFNLDMSLDRLIADLNRQDTVAGYGVILSFRVELGRGHVDFVLTFGDDISFR